MLNVLIDHEVVACMIVPVNLWFVWVDQSEAVFLTEGAFIRLYNIGHRWMHNEVQ